MTREEDIQELCKQVLELGFEKHYNTGQESCPICIKYAVTNSLNDSENHEKTCAYLIAKDLSTNLKIGQ